jgi:hypothetical protein
VGVITGFKITSGTNNGPDEPLVTISVPENTSLNEVLK